MHYSTDNNVPQESELPKWSSRACENVETKESGEHCMSNVLFFGLPPNMREKMAIKILASFWKFLEHEFAQDNAKTVGELMGEIELEIAEKGYNVHEVLNG